MSLTALAKLLQYGVNNNDDRLNEITVRGEEIFAENGGGMRTRSSRAARPEQWTSVPLLAKIFKGLCHEIDFIYFLYLKVNSRSMCIAGYALSRVIILFAGISIP